MKQNKRKMYFALITMFILQTGLLLSLNAEEGEEKIKIRKTFGHYFAFGGVTLDTDKMKDELNASGFNKPKEWAYLFGIGFYGKRKLVFELEFNGIMGQTQEMGVNEIKLYSSTGSLNIGYNFLSKNDLLDLYPYIGSGFGKTALKLNQKKVEFTDVVQTPINNSTLIQNNYTIRAGIGFDVNIKTEKSKWKRPSLGFRVGYQYDVTDNDDWELDDVSISNGPEFSMSGIYGKIVFGRSINKKNRHKDKGCCWKSRCHGKKSCDGKKDGSGKIPKTE